MDYVKLNNGVEMPLLGFGTFQIDGDECEKSVISAIQSGYRLIDTAEAYGNEKAVGNALAKCNVARKELFLTTKVNFKSYENTRAIVETSLRKLQTEYLDLVLLHWPFGNVYAAWRELEALYEEGTIRAIGVSNFEPDRLVDLIAYNKVKPTINQIETHLYCQRQIEHKWENKYSVSHMAYAPLGQGHANEMFIEPAVQEIASKYDKTPAQVLLRRTIQDGVIVIPKSIHAERIAENIDVFDFTLTEKEMSALRELDKTAPMIGNPEKPEMVERAIQW